MKNAYSRYKSEKNPIYFIWILHISGSESTSSPDYIHLKIRLIRSFTFQMVSRLHMEVRTVLYVWLVTNLVNLSSKICSCNWWNLVDVVFLLTLTICNNAFGKNNVFVVKCCLTNSLRVLFILNPFIHTGNTSTRQELGVNTRYAGVPTSRPWL